MKKFIFAVAGILAAAMIWGQSPWTSASEPTPTDVVEHLDATGQLGDWIEDGHAVNLDDNSLEGLRARVRFLEYIHSLTQPEPKPIIGTPGFIPQQVGEKDDDMVIIIGYNGEVRNDLTIPYRIDNYRVIQNGQQTTISGVVVGIGPGALSNLKLTGTLRFQLGENGFSRILHIGPEAFANNALAVVEFPYTSYTPGSKPNEWGLQTLGSSAFANNKLTQVQIPETLQGYYPNWQDINWNDLKDGGDWNESAFDAVDWTGEDSSDGEGSGTRIRGIAPSAFANNILQTVSFPPNIVKVGHHAFTNNNLSGKLTIPYTLTKIRNNAFTNNHLTEVEFQKDVYTDRSKAVDTLVVLDEGAFSVNWLNQIRIPSSVGITDPQADNPDWDGAAIKPGYIAKEAFSHNHLRKIDFPSELTDDNYLKITFIGENAFSDNWLPSVQIPVSVVWIDKGAFSVNRLGEKMRDAVPEDGVLFLGNPLLQGATSVAQVEGNKLQGIGEGAFSFNLLTEISIPDNVTQIRAQAFYDNLLERIVLGQKVEKIGNWAFARNNLASVTLPNRVDEIGIEAFVGEKTPHTAYQSVIRVEPGVQAPALPKWIVDGSKVRNHLNNVTLGERVKYIGKRAFASNELPKVVLPNSVWGIGKESFTDNFIGDVTLSNTLEVIGAKAFYGNIIRSVVFPNTIRRHPLGNLPELDRNTRTSPTLSDLLDVKTSDAGLGAESFVKNSINRSVIIPRGTASQTDARAAFDPPDTKVWDFIFL